MITIIRKYYPALLILFLISCRKWVEDVPVQGQRVLVYTDDYRLLMNNNNDQQYGLGPVPELSCDDIALTDATLQKQVGSNPIQTAIYSWSKPFYVDQQSDYDYNMLYKTIYVSNVVINGIANSKGGSLALKNTILGEALVHRAFSYFMLCNMYAKQYDANTAASDPGVPMLLEAKLFTSLTRTPVKEVYDQIIKDLKQAIPLLPAKADVKFRPSQAAGYALLAKTYLFMRNFDLASAFADSTLAISSQLYDYNTTISGSTYVMATQYNDPQIIMRQVPRSPFSIPQLSSDLLALFNPNDLRYKMFVKAGSNYYPAFTGLGFWDRTHYSDYSDGTPVGLTVNETWLIKAECLARAGKKDDAVQMLNDLRQKRFKPADFQPISAADDKEALQLVINERRIEFVGTGLRWFDQRRLNKDKGLAQTLTRSLGGSTFTLQPDGNGYVFPFASILISQSPEMTQNPK